jgi:hypothetical protein
MTMARRRWVFMVFLPCGRAIYTIRPILAVRAARDAPGAGQAAKSRGKIGRKRRLLLIISCLSYAFSALLRRNIITFQAPEQAYFPN